MPGCGNTPPAATGSCCAALASGTITKNEQGPALTRLRSSSRNSAACRVWFATTRHLRMTTTRFKVSRRNRTSRCLQHPAPDAPRCRGRPARPAGLVNVTLCDRPCSHLPSNIRNSGRPLLKGASAEQRFRTIVRRFKVRSRRRANQRASTADVVRVKAFSDSGGFDLSGFDLSLGQRHTARP